MQNTKKIPAAWTRVLHALRADIFKDAVIAGGALRDLSTGAPIKDVDVFVTAKPGTEVKYRLDQVFGFTGRTVVDAEVVDYLASMDGVVAVYEYDTNEYDVEDPDKRINWVHPFQVIVLDHADFSPEAALERFDFGICQVVYDGECTWHTPAFVADIQLKTFTVCRADNKEQFDRSMIRFERLREKYPDYKLVVPDVFKVYQSDIAFG